MGEEKKKETWAEAKSRRNGVRKRESEAKLGRRGLKRKRSEIR